MFLVSVVLLLREILLQIHKTFHELISEFTHVMLKVCVKLAALSAEWPGRRKTYGPGETRTHDHAFHGHLLYH